MCEKVIGEPIKVRKKGQITLPKNVRELLKINIGDYLYLKRTDSKVILGKVNTKHDILPNKSD